MLEKVMQKACKISKNGAKKGAKILQKWSRNPSEIDKNGVWNAGGGLWGNPEQSRRLGLG